MASARLFVDGAWTEGADRGVVERTYTGEPKVHHASREQTTGAVNALVAAQRSRVLSAYERFEVLSRASSLVEERRGQLSDTLVDETGFTRRDAQGEIDRAVQTLRLSGEEAARLTGEMVSIHRGAPSVRQRFGYTVRVPVGVVAAITPFNSPLNTVAHKVGPALAGGNAVVLKPPALLRSARPGRSARRCSACTSTPTLPGRSSPGSLRPPRGCPAVIRVMSGPMSARCSASRTPHGST